MAKKLPLEEKIEHIYNKYIITGDYKKYIDKNIDLSMEEDIKQEIALELLSGETRIGQLIKRVAKSYCVYDYENLNELQNNIVSDFNIDEVIHCKEIVYHFNIVLEETNQRNRELIRDCCLYQYNRIEVAIKYNISHTRVEQILRKFRRKVKYHMEYYERDKARNKQHIYNIVTQYRNFVRAKRDILDFKVDCYGNHVEEKLNLLKEYKEHYLGLRCYMEVEFNNINKKLIQDDITKSILDFIEYNVKNDANVISYYNKNERLLKSRLNHYYIRKDIYKE